MNKADRYVIPEGAERPKKKYLKKYLPEDKPLNRREELFVKELVAKDGQITLRDAAINAGNSGGALVNTNGQLIGINTAIQSNTGSFTGYGFAIPSNMAQKIVSDLKKYGEVKRAYIGIHISDINNDIKEYFSLNGLNGVLVSKVLSNSAAEKAGIKDLDVIIAINDITVNSVSELHEIIVQFSPGDEIKCKIKRGKKTIDLSFNLQE